MSAKDPEPSCWNCDRLNRTGTLKQDGALWICQACEDEIERCITQGKQAAMVNEAAQEVVG